MYKYNRESFYNHYRESFGKLTLKQVEGLEFLLGKLEESKRIESNAKRAYVLATIKWETADTFQPVTEYGSVAYLRSKKYFPYIGRGYVQLTWKENYRKFGTALGYDLVTTPELANKPEIAWEILEMGMTDNFGIQDPNFTKYVLEDFFDKEKNDYLNARLIINPGDKKSYEPIKIMAEKFYHCLTASIISFEHIPKPRGIE